jgi:hypothetical protein
MPHSCLSQAACRSPPRHQMPVCPSVLYSVCLYVCLSQAACSSQPRHQMNVWSICAVLHLSVCPPTRLFACPATCLPAYMSAQCAQRCWCCWSASASVCLPACLPLWPLMYAVRCRLSYPPSTNQDQLCHGHAELSSLAIACHCHDLPARLSVCLSVCHRYTGTLALLACVAAFCAASFSDPGLVTRATLAGHQAAYRHDGITCSAKQCRTCGWVRPARSKHCSICGGWGVAPPVIRDRTPCSACPLGPAVSYWCAYGPRD